MDRFRRVRRWACAGACAGLCLGTTGASGAVISLTGGPLVGNVAPGMVLDVVVALDANGVTATNIVSHFVSLGVSGLERHGAVAIGSVYDGFTMVDAVGGELFDSGGEYGCVPVGTCTPEVEAAGYEREYRSALALLPPALATPSGSLFAIRFHGASGAAVYRIDLFGESAAGVLWEPPFACAPGDVDCGAQQEAVPFAIVRTGDTTTPVGTARLTVATRVTLPPPPPVPEPTLALLSVSALVTWACRRCSRVR